MITSQTKKVYTVNGQEFTSLEEAQASALAGVFKNFSGFSQELSRDIAQGLIAHADEIVDILTTRPGSLARAKKTDAKKQPRKPFVERRDTRDGVIKFLAEHELTLTEAAAKSDADLLRWRGIGKVWLKRIRAVQPEVAQSSSPDKLDTMLAGLGHGLVPNVPSVLPMKGAQ